MGCHCSTSVKQREDDGFSAQHTQVGKDGHGYNEANGNSVEQVIPPAVSADGQPGDHAHNVGAEDDDRGRYRDADYHLLPRLGGPVTLLRIDLGESDGLGDGALVDDAFGQELVQGLAGALALDVEDAASHLWRFFDDTFELRGGNQFVSCGKSKAISGGPFNIDLQHTRTLP